MFGIVIAFKDYQVSQGVLQANGLDLSILKEFFSGMYFGRTLKNTLLISLYDIVFGFPIPIIFALMLNEIRL